jgi:hypothetical protein
LYPLIFVTLAVPGRSTQSVVWMAESIRAFAGSLKGAPIWVLAPEQHASFSIDERQLFARLDIHIELFDGDPDVLKFPFAAKILAAAAAEGLAQEQAGLLAYLDQDTLVLQEPDEFLLPAEKALGYCPVHHKLIGPAWDKPVDDFWALIYRECAVPADHLFRMETHVGEAIRPYFNAGMFIVRPARGLLAQWWDVFLRLYRQPEFMAYYEKDNIYAIFIHQAIWTGVLLHALNPDQMLELSPKINYPLHLHNDIAAELRPATINELITVRYENIFSEPNWRDLPITEPLTSWIGTHLRERESTEGAA